MASVDDIPVTKERAPEADVEASALARFDQRLSRLESATRRIEETLAAVLRAVTPPAPIASTPPVKEKLFRGWLTYHNLWWLLIFPINVAWLVFVFAVDRSRFKRQEIATTLALSNLLTVVAIRDGACLLMLYNVVVRIPWHKYFFNRMLHCNGGIHTGCALMLLMWTIVVLAMASKDDPVDLTLLSVLCAGLVAMMLLAMSRVRETRHNLFERVHRYLGWFLLVLLTAILMKKFTDVSWKLSTLGYLNASLILVSLFLVFYSWLIIEYKDVHVKTGNQGNVVVVRVQGKALPGAFAKISFDLIEWHAFSVAFSNPEKNCYGLIVSVAGDWTRKLAQKSTVEVILSQASSLRQSVARNLNQRVSSLRSHSRRVSQDVEIDVEAVVAADKKKLEEMENMKSVKAFIRWHRPLGFMYSVYAFKRVICVGTGAGIAPILPHIGNEKTEIHVVWIAKKHREIYGDEICDKVFDHPHHTVYDTAVEGRPSPDIALLTYENFRAEAVFVVSNAPFTEAVRSVCKARKISAFGAVFDS